MDRFNTAVAIVLATILIAALATGSGWGMLRLSEHISADASSLLQGLFVIIVFIERASAILNDVWLGEQKREMEHTIRLASHQLQVERVSLATQRQAENNLLIESMRAPNTAALNQIQAQLAPITISSQIAAKVDQLNADIADKSGQLIQIETKENRARLGLGLIVGVCISAVGLRVLESLFSAVPALTAYQGFAFRILDILITGAVIAGGTSGISAISNLLGTYFDATRQKAKTTGSP